ncbi:MAG: hypothetical protein EAZ87_08300 [Nostocales cyanobacterium]|nr:MAG: hypothetical protein EAZ87_08300 [Nostocales cyanobacterium]
MISLISSISYQLSVISYQLSVTAPHQDSNYQLPITHYLNIPLTNISYLTNITLRRTSFTNCTTMIN